MSFTWLFLLGPMFFRTALSCSGGYHLERGGVPLHDVVGINCKKGATTATMSSRIGKVVASNAEVAKTIAGRAETAPIYTMREALRGYCTRGWGCDQSIGSTISDAIIRSWLWSTATRSSPLGYFSRLLQVVDN